jgi:hypothetical protein
MELIRYNVWFMTTEPSNDMPDYRLLPLELWFEILLWAVQPPFKEVNAHSVDYLPFQPPPTAARYSMLDVKRTLRLVCRLWKHWTDDLFYRDIKICRGSHALCYALSAARSQKNYGRMVWSFPRSLLM